MVVWERNRVRNFTRPFADAYISVLVERDGDEYNQADFFKALAATGIVNDAPDDATRAKRWDSYNNKIREFGLGFKVDERRANGPVVGAWRASEIARAYAAGSLNYREFMAIQCMRWQVPTPRMPIVQPYEAELQRNIQVRPLEMTLRALRELHAREEDSYLTVSEFSQLQRVEQDANLGGVLDDLLGARSGSGRSVDWVSDIPSADIWINEFAETGFVRIVRIRGNDQTLAIVPRWARVEEARVLSESIPLVPYSDLESINEFHTAFSSLPDEPALATLRQLPSVVFLEVDQDVEWDEQAAVIKGRVGLVGGLVDGDLVALTGEGPSRATRSRLYAVTGVAERVDYDDVEVGLSPHQWTLSGQPLTIP